MIKLFLICSLFFESHIVAASLDYAPYAACLAQFTSDGKVNYKALKKNPDSLNKFLRQVSSLKNKDWQRWPANDKVAFWINLYNAATLRLIIDHYPVGSIKKATTLPFASPFKKKFIRLFKQKMSLDTIEHHQLRKFFNEPRIHFALVCASKGCPPLQNRPFLPKTLDQQLNWAAVLFVNDSSKVLIKRETKELYLSRIFDWFGHDFISKYDTDRLFQGRSPEERAVFNFLSQYLKGENDRAFLVGNKFRVKYLDYDWSLNE